MDIGIGKLIKHAESRDAIHIAVAPVTAGCKLKPGDGIRLSVDGTVVGHPQPIGIVDPFLTAPIEEGQKFWMFLLPGSITSLRHDWTHPAFEPEKINGDKLAARRWLDKFAGSQRHTFDALAEILEEACQDGGAWCGDDSNSDDFNAQKEEILRHWEIWTGMPITRDKSDIYFSCAC